MTNKNVMIGQSGGPTSVINSSLYGVIDEVNKIQQTDKILGAFHGIEGVINENLINLANASNLKVEGLKYTPAAALGGCRHKLSDEINDEIKNIFNIFDKYNIGYFFYIGGNDSMDTAYKLSKFSRQLGYDLRVIGIPKTVDNDLVLTHHCPGYGSAVKYIATSVKEAGLHTASMYTSEPVTILETVGRNTGWLPAASALAANNSEEAPHLIYFPEVAFNEKNFLEDVKSTYKEIGGVFIVVGEGLLDEDGNYIFDQSGYVTTDSFGHPLLGGNSEHLKELIEKNLGLKTRCIKLDICQQSAMHFASLKDREDAIEAGRYAVNSAFSGETGTMVIFKNNDKTGQAPLKDIANKEREVPRDWINKKGNYVTSQLLDYVEPLIKGEVRVPLENGLPDYIRIKN